MIHSQGEGPAETVLGTARISPNRHQIHQTEQSGVSAELPVWNMEVNGNVNGSTLRLKPKPGLVFGTKAKHPNPVMPPGIKAQTASQSYFPRFSS